MHQKLAHLKIGVLRLELVEKSAAFHGSLIYNDNRTLASVKNQYQNMRFSPGPSPLLDIGFPYRAEPCKNDETVMRLDNESTMT